MKASVYAAVAATAMMAASGASASMIYNIIGAPTPAFSSNSNDPASPATAQNDYLEVSGGLLDTFGSLANIGFGLVASAENTEDNATYDFEVAFEESAFDNGYSFVIGNVGINEGDIGITTSLPLSAGVYTNDDMKFVSIQGTNASLGDLGFGIFYARDGSTDTVFLSYGDGTGDLDYDDLMVKTSGDVNVIPLPAAGWMLLAGLGGLAAIRRRQKS